MRDAVVNAARSYLGTKWRHRGRNARGMDCVGLVYLSLKAAGIEKEDQQGYGREPWNNTLQNELQRQFGNPTDLWQPGDIALFRYNDEEPRHVGILADCRHGGLSLVHAHNRHGVVEQSLKGTRDLIMVEVYPCLR